VSLIWRGEQDFEVSDYSRGRNVHTYISFISDTMVHINKR